MLFFSSGKRDIEGKNGAKGLLLSTIMSPLACLTKLCTNHNPISVIAVVVGGHFHARKYAGGYFRQYHILIGNFNNDFITFAIDQALNLSREPSLLSRVAL